MSFKQLDKPAGADPDYEAHFHDEACIGGPKGTMFKLECMAIVHTNFKSNGDLLLKQIDEAINAVLIKNGMAL